MGNCLQAKFREEACEQFIKVMRMDGKMLKYTSPLVVRDLMKESNCEEDYMVVHSRNVGHALPQQNKLKGGELYYLIPSHREADHKAFSALKNGNKRVEGVAASCGGAVVNVEKGFTVKIVVSRQQLKTLLLDSCVKEKLVEQHVGKLTQQEDYVLRKGWRPCLETIAEEY